MQIEPLSNLNKLGQRSYSGMQKRWVAKNKTAHALQWDYLQKVNYCIQDFNKTLSDGGFSNKDIVFLIALDTWIGEAVRLIRSCYREEVIKGFIYSNESELEKSQAFIKGLRSITLAHPLNTDQHANMGLDGDIICIDIGQPGRALAMFKDNLFRLTPDGLIAVREMSKSDMVLTAYSKRKGAEFSCHIGFDLLDVRNDASLRIGKLHELDRYLGTLKMRDFI